MHPALELASALGDGLIVASDLRSLGLHPSAIQRLCDSGELFRVRRGLYVASAIWRVADHDERYRIRLRAFAASARGRVILSHTSAAVMHRLPMTAAWPQAAHVFQAGASGGTGRPYVVAHRAGPTPPTTELEGTIVTSLLRTLVDVAATADLSVSVAMLNAALRRDQRHVAQARARGTVVAPTVTKAMLRTELERVAPAHGRARAERAIAFADPESANGGESFSRVRIHELGFAAPELQVRFDDVLGSFAIVDFYWRGVRLIGEFDGALKYTRSREVSGLDPGEVVLGEKRREDALRRRGEGMTRWDWSLVRSPRPFMRQLVEAGVPRVGRRITV